MSKTNAARTARTPRTPRTLDEPKTPATPALSEETTKRLSFPVKPDGTFDLDAMRGSSRDALKTAIADPALSVALGLTSTTTTGSDSKLIAQITGGLYDGLSVVAVAMARRAGYSEQQAAVVAFNPSEKEMLAEPTAAVVNKYFPDLGGKYRDEIMLCLALVNVIGAKILLLRAGAQMLPNGNIVIGAARSTVAPEPQNAEPASPGVTM